LIEFLEANWLTIVSLAALAAIFLLLRNRTTRVSSAEEVWKQGEPIVIEILSNT
jgi:hypothetical protein